LLNQIQPKYRDEPRSRGGLIRLREFIMQDGYSFHKDKEDLDLFYEKVRDAYSRIFERVGLNPIIVKSATGSMGGKEAEEFMVVADIGEDKVVLCSHCHYAANLEVGRFKNIFIKEKPKKSKLVKTPNITSIDELSEFLDIDPHRLAKIVFFENEKKELIVGVVLGDREINERKLSLVTNSLTLLPADSSLIKRKGFEPGFAKPEILKDKVKIVVDEEVWKSNNLITGSNKKDYHLINFNPKKDIKGKVIVGDIAEAREGDLCPLCESKLRIERAIEVGNIFKLGDKYSKDFGISFFDERGKKFYPEEGCYGIGLDRLMATVVEIHHDEKGIIWPQEIAPFDYHFIYLGDKNKKKAEFIYKKLEEKGKRVLFDDRDNSPGEKFADADLIGCPKRILISDKTLKENKIEVKDRKSGKIFILDIESFLEQDV
jgi:prolyl-tRNA synthetase